MKSGLIRAFNFDYNPVSAEWAVISALVTEYGTSFNLGMFGDETEKITRNLSRN